MPYTPEQIKVLRDFRLINPDGSLVVTDIDHSPDASTRPLGVGPKLSQEAIDKFIEVVPDPDSLRWVLHQAAGGDESFRNHTFHLERIKVFFSEHHAKKLKKAGITDPQELQAKLEEDWPRYVEHYNLQTGDEMVRRTGRGYGFYRNWPGEGNLYENIVNAVFKFRKYLPLIKKYNKQNGVPKDQLSDESGVRWRKAAVISENISDYKDIGAVLDAVAIVKFYFGAQKAKEDVRVAKYKKQQLIYDDDYLYIIAPLTYAAAVKFGYPGWSWASPERFTELLSTKGTRDAWFDFTNGNIIAFLRFKVPVPRWTGGIEKGLQPKIYYLTDLALAIPERSINKFELEVYDQENNKELSVDEIRKRIEAEPKRKEKVMADQPIKQGKPIYTEEEAANLLKHFDAAIHAFMDWATYFDPAKIKRSTLEYE